MRISLFAAAVSLTLCTLPAFAAEAADDDLDDLVVVTAQPRAKEVKMVVQTLGERKIEAQPDRKPAEAPNASVALLKTAAK